MGPHAKKRKLAAPVEEITFDPAERQQFLTGFRKRKQARVRHAQEIAEKRAREERIHDRKKIREERKAEYQRAFQEHRKQMELLNKDSDDDDDNSKDGGSDDDQDGEWEGFAEPPPVDYEAEYVDEDKYTTVTVEEMDPSREGLLEYGREGQSDDEVDQAEEKQTQGTSETEASKAAAAKKKQNADKPKKKKKKFRYESKEDRKVNQAKQRLSKAKRAKARRDQ